MPCESKRNYAEDRDDALLVNEKYGIKTLESNHAVKRFLPVCSSRLTRADTHGLRHMNPRLR
jgi:hypothetical protein